MDLAQYLDNKYRNEKRRMGYVEYASVVVRHFHKSCQCGGDNPNCRLIENREWRRLAPTKNIPERNKGNE